MGLNILTYLCTLVAGILFIVMKDSTDMLTLLTRLSGLVFLIPGLVSLLSAVRDIRNEKMKRGSGIGFCVVSVGAMALGILMNIFPAFFRLYVAVVLGVLLILIGIYQFVVFFRRIDKSAKQRLLLIVPALVAIAGIVVLIVGEKGMTGRVMWDVTGWVLIAFSVNGFTGDAITGATRTGSDSDRQVKIVK